MLRNSFVLSFVASALLAFSPAALAGGGLSSRESIDLSQFEGSTFLEAMTDSEGIKTALDRDEKTSFVIADASTILAAAQDDFDPKVLRTLISDFKDGKKGLSKLLQAVAGSNATPASVAGVIAKQLEPLGLLKDPQKVGWVAVKVGPLVTLASGAGTEVRLSDSAIYYNVGYKAGSSDPEVFAKDVKSGRSFGASRGHRALDSSDVDYLKELGSYLGDTQDPSEFYDALLKVLTSCDLSGVQSLSEDGEALTTDFMAIYTAELDRYLMTGMLTHSWQNDLGEVTFLSAYGVPAGLIEQNGQVVQGEPSDYFGRGRTGSGIGETRRDRRALQAEVTKAEEKLNPDVVSAVRKLIGGKPGSDVIHGLMVYLSNSHNQAEVKRNAKKLTHAFGDFLTHLRSDADQITQAVQN